MRLLDKFANNYLLKLIFDHRGSISKTEYLIGHIFLLGCITNFFIIVARESYFWIPNIKFLSSETELRNFVYTFFSQGLFLFFICLYVSCILTTKRCKRLSMGKCKQYLIAILSFLFYIAISWVIFVYWCIDLRQYSSLSFYISIISISITLFAFVILYSSKETKDEFDEQNQDVKQIHYLLQLVLFDLVFFTLLWLLISTAIERNMLREILLSLSIALGLVFLLFCSFKRIKDVELTLRTLFALLLGSIVYEGLLIILHPETYHILKYDSYFFVTFIDSATQLFLTATCFYIVLLPSKV